MSPIMRFAKPVEGARMLFTVLAAAAIGVPAGETFSCTPLQVWDADGPIWCEEGVGVEWKV